MPALVTATPDRPETMIVNGEDITALSDDEIFRRLKELGAEVGPIISSTRTVYERKLYRMMSAEPAVVSNDTSMNGLRFSESESEDVQSTRRRAAASPRPEALQDESVVYETPLHDVFEASTPVSSELPESPYIASARRPLHPGGRRSVDSESFNSSYTRFRERNPNGAQYSPANVMNGASAEVAAGKKSSSTFSTCFEIIFLTFLVIVGYIFYQEIQAYSAAEQEYIDSSAQNVEGDI